MMYNKKKKYMIAIILFFLKGLVIGDQISFNHIIFEPLFQEAKKDISQNNLSDIIFGKSKNYVSKKIILKKNISQKTIELVFPELKDVFFIIHINNNFNIIEKIIKINGNKEKKITPRFSSKDLNKESNLTLSDNIMTEIYKIEDGWLNNIESKEIDIKIFFYKNEQNRSFVAMSIGDEKIIRVFDYSNEKIYNSAGCIAGNTPEVMFSTHLNRNNEASFVVDFCKYDKNGNGYYCEFYESGILKSYVEKKNKKWEKQKKWSKDGRFEGEYIYPAKNKEETKIINEFFPQWMVYVDNIKTFKRKVSSYWNKSTKSPYYRCSIRTQDDINFDIDFFFSEKNDLIKNKFKTLQAAYTAKIEKELTQKNIIGLDSFIFKESLGKYGICAIDKDMVFLLSGCSIDDIVIFSKSIINTYKKNQ